MEKLQRQGRLNGTEIQKGESEKFLVFALIEYISGFI